MQYLENEFLKIAINETGAELVQVTGKKDNTEFIWNGDAKYWAGHAPVLFPCVGSFKNNEYTIDGKKYELARHGFARRSIFQVIEKKSDQIIFELKYNDETLKAYPYKFSLEVIYKLENNSIINMYRVRNIDDNEIYFGIGGHPAFNCPLDADNSFSDYFLEFNEAETRDIMILDDGIYSGEVRRLMEDTAVLPLSHKLFEDDALVFRRMDSSLVTLKSNKSSKSIEMYFGEFSSLGVWTKPGASFLCIEPWVSYSDTVDSTGDFKQKEDIIKLDKNNVFNIGFKMIFNE